MNLDFFKHNLKKVVDFNLIIKIPVIEQVVLELKSINQVTHLSEQKSLEVVCLFGDFTVQDEEFYRLNEFFDSQIPNRFNLELETYVNKELKSTHRFSNAIATQMDRNFKNSSNEIEVRILFNCAYCDAVYPKKEIIFKIACIKEEVKVMCSSYKVEKTKLSENLMREDINVVIDFKELPREHIVEQLADRLLTIYYEDDKKEGYIATKTIITEGKLINSNNSKEKTREKIYNFVFSKIFTTRIFKQIAI